MNHIVATSVFLALVVLAVVSDLRTRRIPNALTLTGLGIALALRGILGWEPLANGMLGAAIAFVPAMPLVLLGGHDFRQEAHAHLLLPAQILAEPTKFLVAG